MNALPVKRKVVLLQHRLMHYRVGLFEKIRAMTLQKGIALHLVHGQPTKSELTKRDVGHLDWADAVTNHYVNIHGRDILWQPFPPKHRDAGLVVMMQESRLVSNYPWLFWRNGTNAKIGYWGHGRNFQTVAPSGLREKWKKLLVGRVDWWFAYTQMTRNILLGDGYPDERITVLDNAIDNEAFQNDLDSVSDAELAALREKVGAGATAPIGLFCGSLYPIKRIGYMIEAADRIRVVIPDFVLAVLGDGPSADEVKAAAETRTWLHWIGAKKGCEKAAWFKTADVVFNPGAVGLHVLDSFCSGTPMITTAESQHGPEIAYLQDGVNGLIVRGSAANFANAVIGLFNDRTRLDAIKQASLRDARRYSLDNMVSRFADGIERCLAMPKK